MAPEGTAALDVVVGTDRVFVTGQGNVGINAFLTVVAYDRVTRMRGCGERTRSQQAAERRRSSHGDGT